MPLCLRLRWCFHPKPLQRVMEKECAFVASNIGEESCISHQTLIKTRVLTKCRTARIFLFFPCFLIPFLPYPLLPQSLLGFSPTSLELAGISLLCSRAYNLSMFILHITWVKSDFNGARISPHVSNLECNFRSRSDSQQKMITKPITLT